tara:strand:+ start:226 stop:690 length:465 start_codon:yes stop_codon:yes gene_type:complete
MSDVSEAAIHFEAVKTSMSQSKAGTILRIAIHPNDVPPSLHTDWVGSRYMVAMVKLDDEDQPEISDDQRQAKALVASAGMLCRNEDFRKYLDSQDLLTFEVGNWDDLSEEKMTANCLRRYLQIESRSELATNSEAREKFKKLQEDFTLWKKNRP